MLMIITYMINKKCFTLITQNCWINFIKVLFLCISAHAQKLDWGELLQTRMRQIHSNLNQGWWKVSKIIFLNFLNIQFGKNANPSLIKTFFCCHHLWEKVLIWVYHFFVLFFEFPLVFECFSIKLLLYTIMFYVLETTNS